MSEYCVFCKIVQKQAPGSFVYEDAQVLAFMDIRPVSEGHVLVIPKQHYENIFDIPAELLSEVYKVTKKVSFAVGKGTEADGISIIQQNGAAAGQEIFHFHVHIIPRFNGKQILQHGEFGISNRDKLDSIAAKLKQHL